MTGSDDYGTEDQHGKRIPEGDPATEPEYVGAYSALVNETCQQWVGDRRGDVERCGREATHTVVHFTGTELAEIASCNKCGERGDVTRYHREWKGEVVDR